LDIRYWIFDIGYSILNLCQFVSICGLIPFFPSFQHSIFSNIPEEDAGGWMLFVNKIRNCLLKDPQKVAVNQNNLFLRPN
jgi:hypothetical protein